MTTLTIILAIVQIIVFIFFGWLGVLQLRDYYRDRKLEKRYEEKQILLKEEKEKYIVEEMKYFYSLGFQNFKYYVTAREGWKRHESSVKEEAEKVLKVIDGKGDE